ncbi:MAG: XylR family transcriptional regulator [Pirellulales bacterium]|nr:XylR family transcriptional regulator [Pirellulales bacterium]
MIESSRNYGRELMRGIAAYAHQAGPWLFFHEERALGDPLPRSLTRWAPDGILARLAGEKLTRQIRALRLPTVDLYHEDETQDIPGVTVDQSLIVNQAIRHFQERGFQNYAYCGFTQVLFSEIRETVFIRQLKGKGISAHVYRHPPLKGNRGLAAVEAHAEKFASELARWLRGLPKPVALMACNDMRAYQILSVCNNSRIAVPEEVAVLGVDNDPIECEFSNPPLSSVDPNASGVGYEAAALLHRLIQGHPKPARRIVLQPRGVVARRSTDVLAFEAPEAAAAVQYVRRHALEPLDFSKIVRDLRLSRSTLERWFQQHLGHSVNTEILSIRLKHIQELLLTTSYSLAAIARRCGFMHVETMSRVFKREVGVTPGKYRRREKSP